MKILFIIFTNIFIFSLASGVTTISPPKDEIKVYIFLHESCRISQYYTLALKELHEKYGSDQIVFEGIFPSQKTKKRDMVAFKQKYKLSFEMKIDKNQELTNMLGATITPEVVVYLTKEKKIIYKGRIDDSYFRVGRRREVTTTSELRDVLIAIASGNISKIENKPAIGCYIQPAFK